MTTQRLTILFFVVSAVLIGMVLQSASVDAFDVLAMTDDRIGGVLNWSAAIGLVGGIASFFVLLRNRDAVKFTGEVIGELRKVTWPSRDETVRATTTVIFTTLFVAALVGVYDFIWKNVADVFLFNAG